MHIYTFRCSGIGCWGDSFNYMVMVKAFQIKPYQEHNQNETACMKYSGMIQLIKKHLNSDLMIQFTTTKVDISIRCKQTRNSGNCKVKRTC